MLAALDCDGPPSEHQTALTEFRTYLDRHLTAPIRRSLEDAPVVTIVGPRQSGKSTLVRELIRAGYPAEYVTLDEESHRTEALGSADGFVAQFAGNVVIDEVQLAPSLLLAIKAAVDRDRRPGRFILTGSADVFSLPRIAGSLVGRTEIHTLWPLSQGEIAGGPDRFVDVIFASTLPSFAEGADIRADVISRALVGGFPEVVRRTQSNRHSWFRSYVETIVQRTAGELRAIAGLAELPRILTLLAARAATLLNRAEMSRALGMNAKTFDRYLALLHQIFVVRIIPAWQQNIGKRVTKHPKVFLSDPGLMGYLQGISANRFMNDPTLAGALLEDFVATELLKQIGWSADRPEIHHFRTHEGDEVDLLLERRNGDLVGIEVKASPTVDATDFRSLQTLRAGVRKKFVRGVVLYTGQKTVRYSDNLVALPISALWKLMSPDDSQAVKM